MNPFQAYFNDLTCDSEYQATPWGAALAWLLPAWAAEWDNEPAAYMNRYAPVLNKIRELSPAPLRLDMERHVHALFNTWHGEPFTPEPEEEE